VNSGGASRDMFWTCEVCKDREVVFVGDGAVPRGAISAEEASLRGWGQSVSGERHCPLHGERIATAPAHDPVNHPAHYTSHPSGVECIDVCESMSFNPGNAVKYLFRRDHKGGRLEDTRKAAWYLRREEARLLAAEQWLPVEGDRPEPSAAGRVLSVEPESAVLAVVLRALLREGGTLPASVAEAAAAVETEIQRLEKE
jgi:hypothetical protein